MEILNQFGIKPILLAAQVVNFLILLFILKKFLYKPILKVLEERKKKIAESLQNAEEIEKRLNEVTDREAESLLKSAREGEKIIKEAGEYAAQIIEDGKAQAEKVVDHAVEESIRISQAEKVRLENEIKENLSDIVTLALEKITGKVVTGKQQKELIEKEVRNLS